MGTAIVIAVIVAMVCGVLFMVRRSGQRAAEGQAATEALKDVVESNRPASTDELSFVRDRYKRR